MFTEHTDGQLIASYVKQTNKAALDTLLHRHYDTTYRRFLKQCQSPDDAADLTQQLWLHVVKQLPQYNDLDKFPSYLMRCVSNLLTDHRRRNNVKNRVIREKTDSESDNKEEQASADPGHSAEKTAELLQQINHLVNTLVPQLPCAQRFAFLIKHESEFWEHKQRLSWKQLAELNGIDVDKAWKMFEQVRNELCRTDREHSYGLSINNDAHLIFVIWTQAQRPVKKCEYTWEYYSEILSMPKNTLKTHYRRALLSLQKGMTKLNS